VRLLSVGRLVEKKGTDDLLEALARLPASLHWTLVHVGGGPLREALQAQARRLGLESRIAWRGAMAQDQLIQEYRRPICSCWPAGLRRTATATVCPMC
jgi:glycosyltransferase involved in cell wall biosynthesis